MSADAAEPLTASRQWTVLPELPRSSQVGRHDSTRRVRCQCYKLWRYSREVPYNRSTMATVGFMDCAVPSLPFPTSHSPPHFLRSEVLLLVTPLRIVR